jgi:MoxR-like ATPase
MPRTFDIIRETASGAPKPPAEPVRIELEPRDAASPFGPYVLSDELATTVNVALALDQPLLVTGEPGCGKTSLAWAVAAQLGCEVLEFHTKSTSIARDLLYTVDNLRRFHDASARIEQARDASGYVEYQALGKAIQSPHTTVVLVDEIDKAPRDFPNDLLNELDRMEFTVAEAQPPRHFRQQARHFVLVTSNSERRLPMPFLRRCVYAHIDFPDQKMLRRIVELHCKPPSKSFGDVAVKRFLELRAKEGLAKRPATGELIAWVEVLARMEADEATIAEAPLAELPALGSLVKMVEDVKVLAEVDAT